MAVTINNFSGIETGGPEEFTTAGTPVFEETVVRTGKFSLALNASADIVGLAIATNVSDSGSGLIFGFAFQASASGFEQQFARMGTASTFNWNLKREVNGDITLRDDSDTTRITVLDPLTIDTWCYIEVYTDRAASNGDAEVFIDDVSVGSVSGVGSWDGGAEDRCEVIGTVTGTYFFDDMYIITGATSSADRLGPAEVYAYQGGPATATPDTTAEDLDAGDWSQAAHTPLESGGTDAEYTDTGKGAIYTDDSDGSEYTGPKADTRIDGDSNIKAIKGISNMQRSGGGATAHHILLGNSVDGTAQSADIDPTQSFVTYFHITEASGGAAGDIPLSTEYCAIGFEMDNAQDYQCQEQWAMLLHVPGGAVEIEITVSLAAALQIQDQLVTANLTGALQTEFEKTANMNAAFASLVELTANLDAALEKEIEATANLQAALQAQDQTQTANLTGALQDSFDRTASYGSSTAQAHGRYWLRSRQEQTTSLLSRSTLTGTWQGSTTSTMS